MAGLLAWIWFFKETAMRTLILASLLLAFSAVASADIAVIVHPDNKAELDAKTIRYIFLAKYKKFPNGEVAIPLDMPGTTDAYDEFLTGVLKKDSARLNAYWARMMFAGKGKPPKPIEDAAEMKKTVSSNPNTIGYIDTKDVDSSVKVVMTFP